MRALLPPARTFARWRVWLCVACVCLVPRLTHAADLQMAEPAHLLVVPMADSTQEVTPEIVAQLYAQLSPPRMPDAKSGPSEDHFVVVGPQERQGLQEPFDPMLFAPSDLALVTADIGKARAAFRLLDLPATQAALQVAQSAFLRLEAPQDHLETFAELLLLRAQAALAASDAQQAHHALVLFSRLVPERKALHPGRYPPVLVNAHHKAQAAVELSPTGLLAVEVRAIGTHEAVQVFVDGQLAPTGKALQRAGPHLVSAQVAGRVSRAVVVEVSEAHPANVTFFLPEPHAGQARQALWSQWSQRSQRQQEPPPSQAELQRLAELCGANALLLVTSSGLSLWSAGEQLPLEVSVQSEPNVLRAAVGQALTELHRRRLEHGAADATKPVALKKGVKKTSKTALSTSLPSPHSNKATKYVASSSDWWLYGALASAALAATAALGAGGYYGFTLWQTPPPRGATGVCCRTGG